MCIVLKLVSARVGNAVVDVANLQGIAHANHVQVDHADAIGGHFIYILNDVPIGTIQPDLLGAEGDELEGGLGAMSLGTQHPGRLQRSRYPGGIVIGPRRARDRVVVAADVDNALVRLKAL